MIFETHAHYEDKRFDKDRGELLLELQNNGISTVVNVGSSMESTKQSVLLANQYDFIYAAIGIHPSDINDLDETNMNWLRKHAKDKKVVAIGEIGLDYYWPKRYCDDTIKKYTSEGGMEEAFADAQKEKLAETMSRQKYWFGRQLDLAKEVGLPVIIHSRDAASDTYELMKEHHAEKTGGVVHCFSYAYEMAKKFVEMGFFIGIGGVVTFSNSKKLVEVVERIPLEYIVLETDSPYLSPEPNRGKRNSSLNLTYVAEKIAEIKSISKEEVIKETERNAYRLYPKAEG